MQWKLESMCDNCPFATSGEGLHLRRSLGKGRWKEILDSLHHSCFPCHKTSTETGNGRNIVCAGSYEYQVKHNLWPQYRQIMERLCEMKKNGDMYMSEELDQCLELQHTRRKCQHHFIIPSADDQNETRCEHCGELENKP